MVSEHPGNITQTLNSRSRALAVTHHDQNQNFVIDNQSPYFLHLSDSPGAIITSIKFDGKNFELWESTVKTSLRSKNKLGFIDETTTKTTRDGRQKLGRNQCMGDGELYDSIMDNKCD